MSVTSEPKEEMLFSASLDTLRPLDRFGDSKEAVLSNALSFYRNGIKLFQDSDAIRAEAELVKAIKPFLSKNTMRNIYVDTEDFKAELLDAMYHIGLIYFNDAETMYMDSYSKAASIFQYCHKFSQKYEVAGEVGGRDYLRKAYMCEAKFLNNLDLHKFSNKQASDDYYKEKQEEYKEYVEDITAIRDITKFGLEEIDDLGIDRVGDRAEGVRLLYGQITEFFVSHTGNGLVQKLLKDCEAQLGAPPCKYAMVGLGSLAAGKMTPWSDLEFAILTENDEYKTSKNPDPVKQKQEKEYFRNLTKLLHIKVINFGETPLRSVGIESFNNFRTGEAVDDWFWDECIVSGFSFDGPHWYASKTPLGRQGGGSGGYMVKKKIENEETGIEEEVILIKPDFELILTPEQMAEFQFDKKVSAEDGTEPTESWYGSDAHLVQGLRSNILISGSENAQELLDQYRKKIREYDKKKPQIILKRSLELLDENLDDFKLKLGDEEEGKLLDVKRSIYRIADRITTELTNYYGIMAPEGNEGISAWDAIDRMHEQGNLSKEGAQHLREALSIAAELRLSTYSHNNGQIEGASTYVPTVEHLTEVSRQKILEETFYIKDSSLLHHFYQIMLSTQEIVKIFSNTNPIYHSFAIMSLQVHPLITTNYYIKGMIFARFMEYDKAIQCIETYRSLQKLDKYSLKDLYILYIKTGLLDKAHHAAKEMLQLSEADDHYNQNIIVESHCNLANVYLKKGEYEKSIEEYKTALSITKSLEAHNRDNLSLVIIHNGLGNAYLRKGLNRAAIEDYLQALKILKSLDFSEKNISIMVNVTNNLSVAYIAEGTFDKAIESLISVLELYKQIYYTRPNHPDIASNYVSLGITYNKKGEYKKALEHLNTALDIFKISFSATPNHPSIADIFMHSGDAYIQSNEYDRAIEYFNKALNIYKIAYATNINHSDIAGCYNVLGNVYIKKGEYEKAIEYFNMTAEIYKVSYACNPYHQNIAIVYNSLGNAFGKLGYHTKEIEHLEIALNIYKTTHSSNLNHQDILMIYNNLGNAYFFIGEDTKAEEFYNKAKGYFSSEVQQDPSQQSIGSIHNNLGSIHLNAGRYQEALKCYTTALEEYQKIHIKTPNHSDIAACYNNMAIVYVKKKEYSTSIHYFNKALEIFVIIHSKNPNHSDIASCYNNLGIAYSKNQDYHKSIDCLLKSLEVYLITYASNKNHPDIADCYYNLGMAYSEIGELDSSIRYLLDSIQIKENLSPSKSLTKDFSSIYTKLGKIYKEKQNSEEALEYYQKALEAQIVLSSPHLDHKDLAETYMHIGNLQREIGSFDTSVESLSKSLAIHKLAYSDTPDHLVIGACHSYLAQSYMGAKQFAKALECFNLSLDIALSHYRDPNHRYIQTTKLLIEEAERKLHLVQFLEELKQLRGQSVSDQDTTSTSHEEKMLLARDRREADDITSNLPFKIKFIFKGSLEQRKLSYTKDSSLVYLPKDKSLYETLTRNLTFVIPEGYGFGALSIRGEEVNVSCSYKPIQKITIGKLGDKSYIKVDREDNLEQKGVILSDEGQKSFGGDVPVVRLVEFFNQAHSGLRIEFGKIRSFESQQFIEEVMNKPISVWPDHFDIVCEMKIVGEHVVSYDFDT